MQNSQNTYIHLIYLFLYTKQSALNVNSINLNKGE